MGILISTLQDFFTAAGRFFTGQNIQHVRERGEELEDMRGKLNHGYEFTEIHGVNVHIDSEGESATWVNERHGGIGVVKPPLGVGESMQLKVTGSGAFAIGIINARWLPHVVSGKRFRNWSYWWPALTNDNKNNTVTIQRIAVQEFQIVESSRVYTKQLDENRVDDFLVVVDIYYGEVKLQIQKDSRSPLKRTDSHVKYSSRHFASESETIRLSQSRSSVSLNHPHPWTLSLVQGPLYKMSIMHIYCDALDDSNTSFVEVFLTNDPPHDLFLDNSAENSMVKIGRFAVENKGQFTIVVESSIRFSLDNLRPETTKKNYLQHGLPQTLWPTCIFKSSNEFHACLDDLDFSSPVLVCLKMFKVKVHLSTSPYDYLEGLAISPFILQRQARPGPPAPPVAINIPRRQPRGDHRVRQNARNNEEEKIQKRRQGKEGK